jgi:hypothetical protein
MPARAQFRRHSALVPALVLAASLPIAVRAEAPAGWSGQARAGGMVYQPADLPAGRVFEVWTPAPLEVGGLQGREAFDRVQREALADTPAADTAPRCSPPEPSRNGSMSAGCELRGTDGAPLTLQVVMLPVQQGRAHWLRVMASEDPALLSRYRDGIGTLITQTVRRWHDDTPTALSSPAPKAATVPSHDEVERALHVAPGRGVKARDLDAVLFTWAQVYRVTGLQYEETIYLLLKDGSAYEGLALPPDEFDAEASRRLQPQRWTRWRRSGTQYQVQGGSHGQDWHTLQGWPAVPGGHDERLTRTFTHDWYASYGGMGGGAGHDSFTFSADGRFEEHGSSSFGTGVVQGLSGIAAGATHTHDRTGSSGTSVVSAPGVGGGSTQQHADGGAYTGRYRIDGWTIELQRDDGRVERRLFLYSNGKRDAVNIGGTGYSVHGQ